MSELMEERAEAAFYKSVKRAPLGHVSVVGAGPMPDKIASNMDTHLFGKLSGNGKGVRADGGNAKESIFPVAPPASEEARGEELYAKSHGSYAPGVRRHLGVSWSAAGIDPTLHTFGKPATTGTVGVAGSIKDNAAAALNPYDTGPLAEAIAPPAHAHAHGSSAEAAATTRSARDSGLATTTGGVALSASGRLVPKAVADFQAATGDLVGMTRGRPVADLTSHPRVYGRPSKGNRDAGDWSAADCLRGDFTAEEASEDPKLGRAVARTTRPGVAAAGASLPDPLRRFGVPSIRTDVPARPVQSIASEADFGDGPTAGALLSPSPYADHGVDESDFVRPRAPSELRAIFESTGHVFASDDEFRAIYSHACHAHGLTPPGLCSVEEMRRSLDVVLEAVEMGERPPAWYEEALALGTGTGTRSRGLGAAGTGRAGTTLAASSAAHAGRSDARLGVVGSSSAGLSQAQTGKTGR